MFKRPLIALAFALLLSACDFSIDSSDNGKEIVKTVDSTAVCFDAYITRGVTTKAGDPGVLTTDTDGTVKLKTAGFGVFGFYGNGALYDETLTPEFMYNQKVTYVSDNWSYSPIKFWPNEAGAAAGSESVDRLSFFAYAPHVVVSSATGSITDGSSTGIIGLSSHSAKGDPIVKYSASLTPGEGVDLCWGEPFIDKTRPSSTDRIDFVFNHSLAQLNVQIDTDIDVESHAVSTLDAGTHIYVRSVAFTGFTTRGSLNLNSRAGNPVWHDLAGTGVLRRDPVIIYDGRADGLEGTLTGQNINEVPATLNPQLIQSKPFGSAELTPGVTNEPANIFNGPSVTTPLMVIPVPGAPLAVTIVYDVETADNNMLDYLSDGVTRGLSIENNISRTVQFTGGGDLFLTAGKNYVVNLHLGLTSVKFDATIGEWDDGGDTPGPYVPPGPVTLGSVKFSQSQVTKWIGETAAHPSLIIRADDGSSMTGMSGLDVTWESSNTGVANINPSTGVLSVEDAGSTVITATVTYNGVTKSGSYTLNINKVNSISIATTDYSMKMKPGAQKTLVATLDYTNNGSVSNWPSVTWTTSSTNFIFSSISDRAYYGSATAIVTAPNGEESTDISVSIGSTYSATTVSNTISLVSEVPQPTFRGYRVAKGFLKRNAAKDYVCDNDYDPIPIGDAYRITSSQTNRNSLMNTYYHQFATLRNELNSEGHTEDDFIEQVDIGGWTIPSSNDWRTIFYGEPLTETKLNDVVIERNAFFYFGMTGYKSQGYSFNDPVYGIILIPDGADIHCDGIVLGNNDGQGNALTGFFSFAYNNEEDDNFKFYQYLINEVGCVVLPCATNRITGTGGKGLMYDRDGYLRSTSSKVLHFTKIGTSISLVVEDNPQAADDYYMVKLVKKVQ